MVFVLTVSVKMRSKIRKTKPLLYGAVIRTLVFRLRLAVIDKVILNLVKRQNLRHFDLLHLFPGTLVLILFLFVVSSSLQNRVVWDHPFERIWVFCRFYKFYVFAYVFFGPF